ncbi:hypothetical protein [Bradyrhizobium uaiense]|uniref:Uncharacterized protein n=1 Tax=Bradyrhizobium uaiense TaxID=2594946 RepID=A0A6P1BC13_9BRAD|nr:hypothetical protein [Bradyrhizobium uaiense]NEU95823.1 hypothetical protein [Bradyrhizobium uaiense]
MFRRLISIRVAYKRLAEARHRSHFASGFHLGDGGIRERHKPAFEDEDKPIKVFGIFGIPT